MNAKQAKKLRKYGAEMGVELTRRTLIQVEARKAVSDRIGYAIAMALGAVVSGLLGWWAVLALGVVYGFGAWGAYRRWKALTR